jgi:hypothetical protein
LKNHSKSKNLSPNFFGGIPEVLVAGTPIKPTGKLHPAERLVGEPERFMRSELKMIH